MKGNVPGKKVDAFSNLLPLAFAQFDNEVDQDSLVRLPTAWEYLEGDHTCTIEKTILAMPFYITWHSDPDKRRTNFTTDPHAEEFKGSAHAEESKDSAQSEADYQAKIAELEAKLAQA